MFAEVEEQIGKPGDLSFKADEVKAALNTQSIHIDDFKLTVLHFIRYRVDGYERHAGRIQ